MTIRRRLILSFLLIFIIPVLMTLCVVCTTFLGLVFFIQIGNHIAIESPQQFQNITSLSQLAVEHGIRHNKNGRYLDNIFSLISPDGNLVILEKDERRVYSYGNPELEPMIGRLRHDVKAASMPGSFRVTEGEHFYFINSEMVRDHLYTLYFVSYEAPNNTDTRFETALKGMIEFDLFALVLFILLAFWFVSKFLMRHIIPPLRQLQNGAEEIEKGNLSIELKHSGNDEFKPVFTAFNRMAEELSSSLKERIKDEENRKELIASISHDIRTPLTAIKAYVEGLRDHVANTPEKQERYLRVISDKVDVLDRMINQMFLLSKMDIGEKAVPMETLSLGECLKKVLESNRLSWEKQGAVFSFKAAGNTEMTGSPMLLERILENLVSNSIKYKKDEKVHITIQVEGKDQKVHLMVSDDGPGVPPSELPRLTETFYRTDKARSRTENGSGLGLAIVYRAVALMKGSLTFSLADPHGLRADLTFPMKEEKHEA